MADQVQPESGLPDDATMRVFERAVELPGGVTVWLRRWVAGDRPGVREWLSDGRWCATRGGVSRLYAASNGLAGGFEWMYRAPQAFDTWQAALVAATAAEAAPSTARRVAEAS